ncbi:MAG: leucine-rich repeat protein [Bacteroidaceae bacterium]|nr:leucine-rich repeat protein [Bacteroidaceae bacterium]
MKVKTIFSCLTARAATTMLAMLLTTLSAWADYSGRCGTNLWYAYHTSTQTLDIYIGDQGSTGSMINYYPDDDYYHVKAPWKNSRAQIKRVNIGEGVTSIGNCAFYGCTALTEVNIASTVTDIGNEAFYNCTSLTSIDIPGDVTRIGTGAFENCWQLADIALPETMQTIENFAFKGCKALTSIDFPSGVTNISRSVFRDSGLTSFTIPEGVTNISDYAFYGCSSLTSVSIPEGVEGIGISAFQRCSSLTSVTIPEGVTSIGDAAFRGCSSLTSVTSPGSVTSIGIDAFRDCSSLTSVTIPGSVTSISEGAFFVCSSLTSVTIPEGVTSISEAAFLGCSSLTSVTIPGSVTSISEDAFLGCSSLTSVYCYAATPPNYDTSAFLGNAENRKIYVPTDCVDDYKNNWSKYRDEIIGIPVYTITLAVSPDNTFGTATVSSNAATQGDVVTLTAKPKPGYRFVWWDVTGGAVITRPSDEQTTLTMPNKNITLTALFRGTEDNPETFTLTLDDNDGNPFGMAEIRQGIKSCKLPTRTRTGYHFLGWATSATGTPAYQAGETILLEHNLTLYARWLQTPVELQTNAPNTKTLSLLNEIGPIDVTLKNRSLLKDGYWNTLCLPFDAELPGSPLEGATMMEMDASKTYFDSATGTLHLYFESVDKIEAGKPYIIRWGEPITDPDTPTDAIFNPTFSGVSVSRVGPGSVVSDDGIVTFTGAFAPVRFENGNSSCLYMGNANTIRYFGTSSSLSAFMAFFSLTDGNQTEDLPTGHEVKAFMINVEGESPATGILDISQEGRLNIIPNEGWYDLSGRRINGKPSMPGIYINNGRKLVIK